jgi:hypothetical protein
VCWFESSPGHQNGTYQPGTKQFRAPLPYLFRIISYNATVEYSVKLKMDNYDLKLNGDSIDLKDRMKHILAKSEEIFEETEKLLLEYHSRWHPRLFGLYKIDANTMIVSEPDAGEIANEGIKIVAELQNAVQEIIQLRQQYKEQAQAFTDSRAKSDGLALEMCRKRLEAIDKIRTREWSNRTIKPCRRHKNYFEALHSAVALRTDLQTLLEINQKLRVETARILDLHTG